MNRRDLLHAAPIIPFVPLAPALVSCANNSAQRGIDLNARTAEVAAAETAFARTMADRNFEAFMSYIAEGAVFINGNAPLRGKVEIGQFWKRFFTAKEAPFAWRPQIVETFPSGDLAYSEGPVTSLTGNHFMTYVSTWQREPQGAWRVVFDNGFPVCATK